MIADLFSFGWNYNLGATVILGIRSDLPAHLNCLKVGSVMLRMYTVYPKYEAEMQPY